MTDTTPSFSTLELQLDGAVARIWLDQPDTRNAFDDTVIVELTRAFEQAGAAPAVKAIVLGARGSAFCAGANLHWMRRMADYSREQNLADAGQLARMLRTIAECPKPTVARVQGDAVAGGVGLIAACDMAVGVASAGFCLSEVKIGLVPATISPYVLRAIGTRAAQRYFLTAERFDAQEARRIGLLHEVAADADALDAQIDVLLRALTCAGPAALRACKRLIADVAGHNIDDALIARTVEVIADVRASDEGREGVQAFLQKRRAVW